MQPDQPDTQRLEEIAGRLARLLPNGIGKPSYDDTDVAFLRDLKERLEVGEGGLREKLLGKEAVEAVAKVQHGGASVGGEHSFDYVDGEDRELALDGARRTIAALAHALDHRVEVRLVSTSKDKGEKR